MFDDKPADSKPEKFNLPELSDEQFDHLIATATEENPELLWLDGVFTESGDPIGINLTQIKESKGDVFVISAFADKLHERPYPLGIIILEEHKAQNGDEYLFNSSDEPLRLALDLNPDLLENNYLKAINDSPKFAQMDEGFAVDFDPNYQGKGLGTYLMRLAVRLTDRLGYKYLSIIGGLPGTQEIVNKLEIENFIDVISFNKASTGRDATIKFRLQKQ